MCVGLVCNEEVYVVWCRMCGLLGVFGGTWVVAYMESLAWGPMWSMVYLVCAVVVHVVRGVGCVV